MTDRTISEVNTAAGILAMNETEVARFTRKCVRNRSLSTVVSNLNNDLLYGSEEESSRASKALKHIGFV